MGNGWMFPTAFLALPAVSRAGGAVSRPLSCLPGGAPREGLPCALPLGRECMAQRNDGLNLVAAFLQVHTASVLHALDTAPARLAAFFWLLLEVRIYSLLPDVWVMPVASLCYP